ncbi:hypothetical protein HPB52_025120 [Rhipicephalus sanguineus]|uniref:Regulatory protein zeste n=1 Tax=Rhipicephalus sanguineus TaxID=34632 RepID=A0A9D4SMJ0_RHISA|nr:hypothetical protein HPB52_025120 [Rhipicephalus sanguineus]
MSSQRNVRLVGPRGRASDSQKDLIIRFMEEHPFLARRPFDPCPEPMAAEKRRRLWRQLVAEVNAVGPMSKSVDQWQSWWRKQVHDARQQAARRGTGGDYLPRWRDEVPNVAVEVVLSEGPAPGEATDSSDVAVPSQDHALPQAWPASRAVALERLANEARQQRDVTQRQTAALERLVELHTEELKEIRCIGALAQTISTALQQGTEECE